VWVGGEAHALAGCAGGGAHGWNVGYGLTGVVGRLQYAVDRCVGGWIGSVRRGVGGGTLLGPEGSGALGRLVARADHREAHWLVCGCGGVARSLRTAQWTRASLVFVCLCG
jgi:hypothetical protein